MAASSPFVVQERCHCCSKWRNPREILHLPGKAAMCWNCHEWHVQAIRMLSGTPPKGCQECNRTFAELTQDSVNGNTPMYLHQKDGVYQVLCRKCSDAYERKRLDLYGDTVYGHLRNLKGAK